jgi:hypothetical protein
MDIQTTLAMFETINIFGASRIINVKEPWAPYADQDATRSLYQGQHLLSSPHLSNARPDRSPASSAASAASSPASTASPARRTAAHISSGATRPTTRGQLGRRRVRKDAADA